jgi:hypothetical protein
MGSVQSRVVGEEGWGDRPWSAWRGLVELSSVLPTLAASELATRGLLLACALHARRSGQEALLASCGVAGAARVLAAGLRGERVWFPSAAQVNLGAQRPLPALEAAAALQYAAAAAARRAGYANSVAQASTAALLALLLEAAYASNGTRYLWWTWHDADPKVSRRLLGVPLGSLMLSAALAGAQSLCAEWLLLAPHSRSIAQGLAPQLALLEPHQRAAAEACAAAADGVRAALLELPGAARALLTGLAAAAAAPAAVALVQVGALDRPGVASARSFKLMLLALFCARAGSARAQALGFGGIAERDEGLVSAVIAFLTVQAVCAAGGDPCKHVSTGLHQPVGTRGAAQRADCLGNLRDEVLGPEGPQLASQGDFSVEGARPAALRREIARLGDNLEQLRAFVARGKQDVFELEGSLEVARQMQQRTSERLQSSAKTSPGRGTKKVFDEFSQATDEKVAALARVIEVKKRQASAGASKLEQREAELARRIADLEVQLSQASYDANGAKIVPASPFGPGSEWYTVRGKRPANHTAERVIVSGLALAAAVAYSASFVVA